MVEQVLFESILPLPSAASSSATKEKTVDEVAWTDRLLSTMRYLSDKSINILIGISGLKATYVYYFLTLIPAQLLPHRRPNLYDVFLDSCIKNNVCLLICSSHLVLTTGTRAGLWTEMRIWLSNG